MTQTADLTRLMNNVRVRCPGAIDSAIKVELFNTLNEFFQDTNIWWEDVEFNTVPQSGDTVTNSYPVVSQKHYVYVFEPSSPASIVRLMGVVDENSRPLAAIMDTPGLVQLAVEPNEVKTYTARFALTVNDPLDNDSFPVFPQWVLNRYQSDIIDGLCARMMSQRAKPYSDPQLAMLHRRQFLNAKSEARIEAKKHNTFREQPWIYPQQFYRRKAGPARN